MSDLSVADPTSRPATEMFVGRQPILDRAQRLHAYELLFRSCSRNRAAVTDDMQATATVITNVFSEFAIDEVLGNHPGFINIDRGMLFSDAIEFLPKNQVVLELLETIEPDAEVVARCRDLKAAGFTLALDDIVQLGPDYDDLMPFISLVKVDLMGVEPARLAGLTKQIHALGKQVLAEKVDSREQMLQCLELGFDLFQGYFFAKPEIINGRKLDHSQSVLMNLMGLIQSDADTDDLEHVFKLQPGLSLNLLRLTNSAASGLAVRVTSLRHAITVLGRRQLQRWLQLLLFVGNTPPGENSLLQLAATRGRLMELLTQKIRPDSPTLGDHAFMTGILSLAPVLLGQPIEQIVASLPVIPEVESALLRDEGLLGKLLALARQIETNEGTDLRPLAATLPGLSSETLNSALVGAVAWANKIGTEA